MPFSNPSDGGACPVKLCLDLLIYLVVRLLLATVQALRIETCAALARPLAWLLCDVLGVRQRVVDENLQYAFPELTPTGRRSLARRHWEHILLMLFEMAHATR